VNGANQNGLAIYQVKFYFAHRDDLRSVVSFYKTTIEGARPKNCKKMAKIAKKCWMKN
jgi:hypothetical protein